MFCEADRQVLGRGSNDTRVFRLLNASGCGLLHNPLGPDWLSISRTFWNHFPICSFPEQWGSAALAMLAPPDLAPLGFCPLLPFRRPA